MKNNIQRGGSIYKSRGSLLPYPFRAIYCRHVEEQLVLYNMSVVSDSFVFTEKDGDYPISKFNEYRDCEADLMFIFCLWREIRKFRNSHLYKPCIVIPSH